MSLATAGIKTWGWYVLGGCKWTKRGIMPGGGSSGLNIAVIHKIHWKQQIRKLSVDNVYISGLIHIIRLNLLNKKATIQV